MSGEASKQIETGPGMWTEAPQPKLAKLPPRLVVVEQVYFQGGDGEQPTAVEGRWSRDLGSDEQPYVRRLKVGPEWKPLDCGWLECCSMLLIQNDAPRFDRIPTAEEKAAAFAKIVELAFDEHGGHWLIPPGADLRACPSDCKALRLRCRSGTATITLHLFPA